MKPFSRIAVKHGHEDWMPTLNKIGKADTIIALALTGKIEGLKHTPMVYSDYHGVGQLETPYFIVQVGTFPSRVEEERLTTTEHADHADVPDSLHHHDSPGGQEGE